MKHNFFSRYDKPLAAVWILLSILFVVLAGLNDDFFRWVFARHHNQLSWYIRPLFLIPFCIFAYKRSLNGIFATVFLLLTSMFWFPEPAVVNEQVKTFLEMEQTYLTGDWSTEKILITLLVPVSMTALALAFWKRSLWLGISVLVFIAVAKMFWSVAYGGASGTSVIVPAVVGLAVCIVLVGVGFRRMEHQNRT